MIVKVTMKTLPVVSHLGFGSFCLASTLAFPDDGKENDSSGIFRDSFDDLVFKGSELSVYYANISDYEDEPYMIEGYWMIPINRFLSVTPALVYGDLDEGSVQKTFVGFCKPCSSSRVARLQPSEAEGTMNLHSPFSTLTNLRNVSLFAANS
jgi:hypothetical protein